MFEKKDVLLEHMNENTIIAMVPLSSELYGPRSFVLGISVSTFRGSIKRGL